MKGNSKKLALFLSIAAIAMFSTAAMAWDNDHACSPHLLHGKFIYGGQGFTLFTPPPTGIPFDQISDYVPSSLAGTVTFDGDGNLTSFDFANLGGGGFPRTGTGTYAVDTTNPEFCAFNATWTFSSTAFGLPPITLHFYMVRGLNGSVVNVVSTDPGNIFFGPFYKQ